LPACTSSAIAPTVSSIGTSGSDAVLVVEVDVVDAEALERTLQGVLDVGRAAVQPARAVGIVGVEPEPELGRELDYVATAGDRTPHEPFVVVRPVDLGGVEERHAELERAVDRLEPQPLVRTAVGVGHPHAAQAHRRHLESLASQLAPFHRAPPSRGWRERWLGYPDGCRATRRGRVANRLATPTGALADATQAPSRDAAIHENRPTERTAHGSHG
jgi:hypothetical protein